MIVLDMHTIVFTGVITTLICGVLITRLWIQYRKRYNGLLFWAINFNIQFLVTISLLFRGQIPDWISITFANILIVLSIVVFYSGLTIFFNQKISQLHNYVLLVIFAGIQIYFTFFEQIMNTRTIIIELFIIIFYMQILWLLLLKLKSSDKELSSGVLLVCVGYLVVSFSRIIFLIFYPEGNDLFNLMLFDVLMIFCYIMLSIILAYNLIFMIGNKISLEVKVQEEKFNKAFYLSPNAIIITRKSDGKIIEVNKGFERITGYSREEAVGNTTFTLRLWENNSDRDIAFEYLHKNGRIINKEFSFRKKDGKIINTLYFAEIITIDKDLCVLATAVDITKLKKDEEELRKIKHELESTLEDFYTLRISMSNNFKKNQIDLEIKKRLDKLKKSV